MGKKKKKKLDSTPVSHSLPEKDFEKFFKWGTRKILEDIRDEVVSVIRPSVC